MIDSQVLERLNGLLGFASTVTLSATGTTVQTTYPAPEPSLTDILDAIFAAGYCWRLDSGAVDISTPGGKPKCFLGKSPEDACARALVWIRTGEAMEWDGRTWDEIPGVK